MSVTPPEITNFIISVPVTSNSFMLVDCTIINWPLNPYENGR